MDTAHWRPQSTPKKANATFSAKKVTNKVFCDVRLIILLDYSETCIIVSEEYYANTLNSFNSAIKEKPAYITKKYSLPSG